jgi:hypothetical protein
MPFIWFQRSANPTFDDQLTQECARGGLSAPRIVQEASDRDTVLSLVQHRIGIAWLTESIRWHCPRGVVLLPVVDMNVRLPFNLTWKKDNSSPLLQKFVAQVQATKVPPNKWTGSREIGNSASTARAFIGSSQQSTTAPAQAVGVLHPRARLVTGSFIIRMRLNNGACHRAQSRSMSTWDSRFAQVSRTRAAPRCIASW